ncbi:MAG: Lar family restriction alleviation protein, partial [Pseudomonadota bacterium]|nr:Lar family restriction alleviation protein [Pseudomonadota bacterium]
MTANPNLSTCPFCGASPWLRMTRLPEPMAYVRCGECDTIGPKALARDVAGSGDFYQALERIAVAKWNSRSPVLPKDGDALSELVAGLEYLAEDLEGGFRAPTDADKWVR